MIREIDNVSVNPFGKRLEYLEDGKVLGFLDYSLIYDRVEIDNVFVFCEWRNRGIGTKLLSRLIDICIDKDLINITLEVRVSNFIAKSLYKKMGFEEVAIRKFYYGNEDAILMEKRWKK